jgi:hypothetical protein
MIAIGKCGEIKAPPKNPLIRPKARRSTESGTPKERDRSDKK